MGGKVVLVDGLHALGGQAVNAVIGTFCGFFSNGYSGYQTVHGIADGILRDLGAQGALHYRHGGPSNTIVVQYDEVALARWIEEAVRQSGITVLLGAVMRAVTSRRAAHPRNRACDALSAMCSVAATGFVDATGDAALAWNAGLACREAAEGPIYGTQMCVIEGIDETKAPERPDVAARLKQKAKDYGLTRESGFAFVFPGKSVALVNMTHVETPLDPIEATQKSLEGKVQADRAVAFLRGEYPAAFGNARVRTYGDARRAADALDRRSASNSPSRTCAPARKFPDAVARTGWPIELHDTPQGHVWEAFPDDHLHTVPFGSLVSPECDNMVAAGRNIDGDVAALSSVRVMGPCIAMGAAAAHALDLAGAGSVHQIDAAALRERVKDNVERVD